jgi:hypothetical protein
MPAFAPFFSLISATLCCLSVNASDEGRMDGVIVNLPPAGDVRRESERHYADHSVQSAQAPTPDGSSVPTESVFSFQVVFRRLCSFPL